MFKAPKVHFTGQGPFSKINKFTTRLRMKNVSILSDHDKDIRGSGSQNEFDRGVAEYHRIAGEDD
jgi:hypothetical protein